MISPMEGGRAQRLEPEARRRQILDSTLALIAERGFEGLTVDRVARAAGITRPVIYDLFGDLGGLLDALVEHSDRRALAAVEGALPDPDAEQPPDQLLGGAMRAFLEAVVAEPEIWRLVLLPADGTPVAVRGRIERRRAELARQIAAIVERVASRHRILAGVDIYGFARVLIGIAEDMGRLVLEKPRTYTPERVATATAQLARLVPGGRGPRAAGQEPG